MNFPMVDMIKINNKMLSKIKKIKNDVSILKD